MTTQPTALNTYLQRLPMILDKIEALRQLADNHFGHSPDSIPWGHAAPSAGRSSTVWVPRPPADVALGPVLSEFKAQKKTSEDVFRWLFGGAGGI